MYLIELFFKRKPKCYGRIKLTKKCDTCNLNKACKKKSNKRIVGSNER